MKTVESYQVSVSEKSFTVNVGKRGNIRLGTMEFNIEILNEIANTITLKINDKIIVALCKQLNETNRLIWLQHHVIPLEFCDSRSKLLATLEKVHLKKEMCYYVTAPMPGHVTKIRVKPGDLIEKGTGLLLLEAMKMENEIRAIYTGKVAKVLVDEGVNVEKDQEMMVIEIY